MSKKAIKIIPFAILLAGVLGFVGLMIARRTPHMAPSQAETAVVETARMQAKSGPIRILGDGFVRPRAEIEVTPQVSGRIIKVSPNLISGGHLAKGEQLFQIDPTPFQADLDQAVANRQAALANLDNLRKQYERSKTLIKRNDISQAQLDDTFSKLLQVKADVTRYEALIERRKFDLAQTSVVLPFDARVVEESVDIGDTVSIGQKLAQVYETGTAEITVSLTEKDAALIPELWSLKTSGKHSPALVTAKFGGGTYEWDAYLDRVNAGLNRDTRTVDVVVAVPDPEVRGRPVDDEARAQEAPPLLIGTYADVSLTGRNLEHYYEVPSQALREGPAIWVATPGGTLSIIPVKPVREANSVAIVTADRDLDGQQLIVSNLAVALPDMPLIVADGEAKQ